MTNSVRGKPMPLKMPVLMVDLSAIKPTIAGPIRQPMSPPKAIKPKREVPPSGRDFAPKLSVAGQRTAVENPHKAHPAILTQATGESPIIRYPITVANAAIVNSFSNFILFESKPKPTLETPMHAAKTHVPSRSQ